MLSACVETERPEPVRVADVFPLQPGLRLVYAVRETTFTTEGESVQTWYQEVTQDSLVLDPAGDPRVHITLLRRPGLAAPAIQRMRGFLWRDPEYAYRKVGNLTRAVLRFPIELGKTWDGNAWNGEPSGNFMYIDTDTVWAFGDTTFRSCVHVRQRAEKLPNLSDILTWQIYAPGIGRVYARDRYLVYDYTGVGRPELRTESYIREYSLIEYGFTE